VSIGRIEEYLERKRWEYLSASKKQKGRILDEVCGALHYHRKAAVRTLKPSTGVAEGHTVIGGFHLGEDFLQSQIPAVVEEFVKIRPAVLAPAPCTGYRALSPFIKPCLMPSCRTPLGRESSSKARMVSI